MIRVIHGEEITGISIDPKTRCSHYNTDLDIIAIKFKCCGKWFPCYECHHECADHPAKTWPADEWSELAILCGACGDEQSITDYLEGNSICPACCAKFNPGCAKHYHLYFGD